MSNVRLLTLRPSGVLLIRLGFAMQSLWETMQGEVVYTADGVVDPARPLPPPGTFNRETIQKDLFHELRRMAFEDGACSGIECKGFEPKERLLLCRAPDGLFEAIKVTCFESIQLDEIGR